MDGLEESDKGRKHFCGVSSFTLATHGQALVWYQASRVAAAANFMKAHGCQSDNTKLLADCFLAELVRAFIKSCFNGLND